jgi:hypothetical protein
MTTSNRIMGWLPDAGPVVRGCAGKATLWATADGGGLNVQGRACGLATGFGIGHLGLDGRGKRGQDVV